MPAPPTLGDLLPDGPGIYGFRKNDGCIPPVVWEKEYARFPRLRWQLLQPADETHEGQKVSKIDLVNWTDLWSATPMRSIYDLTTEEAYRLVSQH